MPKALDLSAGSFYINPESIQQGFTQSEMTLFDDCSEAWYLNYGLMLEQKGNFSWAKLYGLAIHASLEEFYMSKGKRCSWDLPKLPKSIIMTSQMMEDFEYWDHVGRAQIEAYAQQYKDDFKIYDYGDRIEVEPHIEFEGLLLKGKIDALPKHNNAYYVKDHKTCSRLDQAALAGWGFRFQFLYYCWLASKHKDFAGKKIKGIIINAIKKPEIKMRVGEGVIGFAARVRMDMLERPDSYFYRDRGELLPGQLQRFEDEMLRPKVERLKFMLSATKDKQNEQLKAAFLRNKNTNSCYKWNKPCQFFDLCKNGIKVESARYTQRTTKHNELGSENT
jgi:hypothetical protein